MRRRKEVKPVDACSCLSPVLESDTGNWLSQLQEHPYVLPGGAQLSLCAEGGSRRGLENLGEARFLVFVQWLEAWKKRCEELRHDSFAAAKTEWRIGHRLPRRTTRWEPFLL